MAFRAHIKDMPTLPPTEITEWLGKGPIFPPTVTATDPARPYKESAEKRCADALFGMIAACKGSDNNDAPGLTYVASRAMYASVTVLPDAQCGTAMTDGNKIYIGEEFAHKCTLEQINWVMAHEVRHIDDMHIMRIAVMETELKDEPEALMWCTRILNPFLDLWANNYTAPLNAFLRLPVDVRIARLHREWVLDKVANYFWYDSGYQHALKHRYTNNLYSEGDWYATLVEMGRKLAADVETDGDADQPQPGDLPSGSGAPSPSQPGEEGETPPDGSQMAPGDDADECLVQAAIKAIKDAIADMDEAEREEFIAQYAEDVTAEREAVARAAGVDPADVGIEVKEVDTSRSLADILQATRPNSRMTSWSYSSYNLRIHQLGGCMLPVRAPSQAGILVLLDASGSMFGGDLEMALQQLCSMVENRNVAHATVAVFDTGRILDRNIFTADNPTDILACVAACRGGGGTSFDLPVAWADRYASRNDTPEYNTVYILTDGCASYSYKNKLPLVWASTYADTRDIDNRPGNKHFKLRTNA